MRHDGGEVRVMVVEPRDAPRRLAELLHDVDGIRVVASSGDPEAALRAIARTTPSLVLIAVEVAGAAELTRRIMTEHPTPVVAVVDADDVAHAGPVLAEGAVSAQLRPQNEAAARRFPLVVQALAQVSVVRRRHRPVSVTPPADADVARGRSAIAAVGVAASTGGPVALQQLFTHLPRALPVPVLVVQHIVVGFTTGLVASLQAGSPFPIRVPAHGECLQPSTVYLAPDGHHLTVTRFGRAHLSTDPPVAGYRPSATALFASLAAAYGPAVVAVVLTGMGSDGLAGLREVRRAGGHVLAQDRTSSVVYGMPGAAVDAGITDLAAPIDQIAHRIAQLTATGTR